MYNDIEWMVNTHILMENMVEIPNIRTKLFEPKFFICTAREWNSLPTSVFPMTYNVGVFKIDIDMHHYRDAR